MPPAPPPETPVCATAPLPQITPVFAPLSSAPNVNSALPTPPNDAAPFQAVPPTAAPAPPPVTFAPPPIFNPAPLLSVSPPKVYALAVPEEATSDVIVVVALTIVVFPKLRFEPEAPASR